MVLVEMVTQIPDILLKSGHAGGVEYPLKKRKQYCNKYSLPFCLHEKSMVANEIVVGVVCSYCTIILS